MGIDLNNILTTYVDLKYNAIWSAEKLKEVKWELKDGCTYFRLVKQGSILIYLTSHVFTMMLILFMAVIRRCYFSLGYVFMILPKIREGAHVLKQNLIAGEKEIHDLEEKIEDLNLKLTKLEEQV